MPTTQVTKATKSNKKQQIVKNSSKEKKESSNKNLTPNTSLSRDHKT